MTEHLICIGHYLYAVFVIHNFTGEKADLESLDNCLKVLMLVSGRVINKNLGLYLLLSFPAHYHSCCQLKGQSIINAVPRISVIFRYTFNL